MTNGFEYGRDFSQVLPLPFDTISTKFAKSSKNYSINSQHFQKCNLITTNFPSSSSLPSRNPKIPPPPSLSDPSLNPTPKSFSISQTIASYRTCHRYSKYLHHLPKIPTRYLRNPKPHYLGVPKVSDKQQTLLLVRALCSQADLIVRAISVVCALLVNLLF